VLSEIGGLDIDPKDKNCVTSFWKGGAADIGFAQYCWSNGTLLKRKEYSVSPLINEDDGELACYEHIETTYTNGKAETKRTCTMEF
jgi:hypothetical protein